MDRDLWFTMFRSCLRCGGRSTDPVQSSVYHATPCSTTSQHHSQSCRRTTRSDLHRLSSRSSSPPQSMISRPSKNHEKRSISHPRKHNVPRFKAARVVSVSADTVRHGTVSDDSFSSVYDENEHALTPSPQYSAPTNTAPTSSPPFSPPTSPTPP